MEAAPLTLKLRMLKAEVMETAVRVRNVDPRQGALR